MKKVGYPPNKAAAIPAFASYATLFFISHIEASKLGLSGIPRSELPGFFSTLRRGLHFLLPLFVRLYELIVLRHSPELAAFHAICVMGAIMLVQRFFRFAAGGAVTAGIRDVVSSLAAGARNMVSVALATACAGIIAGIVSLGLGGLIAEVIEVLSSQPPALHVYF